MGPGEKARRKRIRERKAAEYRAKLDAIRAAHPGARCGNCTHIEEYAYGRGKTPDWTCKAHSDFHGYAIVETTGLCPWWKEKVA